MEVTQLGLDVVETLDKYSPEVQSIELTRKFEDEMQKITEKKSGRVQFQGTSWKAITYDTSCKPGDSVEIMKKDNLTLIVSKKE